jgi:hypothetical protein
MVWHVAPFSPARQGNGSAYATDDEQGMQHQPPTMSRMAIATMNDSPGSWVFGAGDRPEIVSDRSVAPELLG